MLLKTVSLVKKERERERKGEPMKRKQLKKNNNGVPQQFLTTTW